MILPNEKMSFVEVLPVSNMAMPIPHACDGSLCDRHDHFPVTNISLMRSISASIM